MRRLTPPGSLLITLVHIDGLTALADLERLVLAPMAHGGLSDSPAALVRSGRFPAPWQRVVEESAPLVEALLSGQVVLHVDGYPEAVVLGRTRQRGVFPAFGPDRTENTAIITTPLAGPNLRLEHLDGGAVSVIYLQDRADAASVRAIRDHGGALRRAPQGLPWWRALLDAFRLQPVLPAPCPVQVQQALEQGYVAILSDAQPVPMLAPATLELLLRGPGDSDLPAGVQRLVAIQRLVAAGLGMTLGSFLIAVSGYHHSLVPGPFLVAIAATRQNMPFATVLEMFLIAILGDAAHAAAARSGNPKIGFFVWVGVVLAAIGAMQMGVLGAISGVTAIVATLIRETLPNPSLARAVRTWRYPFMAAAAGLGLYGLTLLVFALLVYLGEERAFGRLIRQGAEGASS